MAETTTVQERPRRRPYTYEIEARSLLGRRYLDILRRLEPRLRHLEQSASAPFDPRRVQAQALIEEGWKALLALDDFAERVYKAFDLEYRRPVALREIRGETTEPEPSSTPEE